MRWMLLGLAALSACGTPARGSRFATVYAPDGTRVHLTGIMHDTTTVGGDGRVRVDAVEYALLVVTQTECDWSHRFVTELVAALPHARRLRVRPVLLLVEKHPGGAAPWLAYAGQGVRVLVDRDRACYDAYVVSKTPSLNVIDRWGNALLACDGYVDPRVLLDKIERRDFAGVKATGG